MSSAPSPAPSPSPSPSLSRNRLPARWASVLARDASNPEESAFDARLDAFLDTLHRELVAARAAKDSADAIRSEQPRSAKAGVHMKEFRKHMSRVQTLFSGEGRDFAEALEERYPGFIKGICGQSFSAESPAAHGSRPDGGYGEDTIELAYGIERLEAAVREEESRRQRERRAARARAAAKASADASAAAAASASASAAKKSPVVLSGVYAAHENAAAKDPGGGSTSLPRPRTPATLHTDETLCLMQSDIQALKLELLRLQRSKGGSFDSSVGPSAALSTAAAGAGHGRRPEPPFSTSTVSPPRSGSSLSPTRSAVAAGVAYGDIDDKGEISALGGAELAAPSNQRRYVSHLEQMRARLEALERKPLAPTRGMARAHSNVRVGRTRTMTNLYSATSGAQARSGAQKSSLSAASLPRPSGHSGNENSPPNTFVTPPTAMRRLNAPAEGSTKAGAKAKSNGSSSNVVRVLGEDDDFNSPTGSISSSTPSPPRERSRHMSRTFTAGTSTEGNESARPEASPKTRLFSIDAPEELLSRPQSVAAARDIQRYSLKVARRFGPVPGNTSGTEAESNGQRALSPQEVDPIGTQPLETFAAGNEFLRTFAADPPSSRPTAARSELRAPLEKYQAGTDQVSVQHQQPISLRPPLQVAAEPPSTVDTVNSGGSGERVVEELQGDVWVRKGNLWKRWRKRYASIVSHQFFGRVLCLFSYDSAGNVITTKSEIVVLNGALCRSISDTVDIHGKKQYVFVLRTAKEYYFAIHTEKGCREWVLELRQAARAIQRTPSSGPPSAGSSVIPQPATTPATASMLRQRQRRHTNHSHQQQPPTQAAQGSDASSAPQAAGGRAEARPLPKPVVKQGRLPSRKSALGFGRSVTHHGVERPAQSGGIPMQRQRFGPFRRPVNL